MVCRIVSELQLRFDQVLVMPICNVDRFRVQEGGGASWALLGVLWYCLVVLVGAAPGRDARSGVHPAQEEINCSKQRRHYKSSRSPHGNVTAVREGNVVSLSLLARGRLVTNMQTCSKSKATPSSAITSSVSPQSPQVFNKMTESKLHYRYRSGQLSSRAASKERPKIVTQHHRWFAD